MASRKGFRTCPRGLEVQSILFDNRKWTPSEALDWARSHGFSASKLLGEVAYTTHETPSHIRIRVQPPGKFKGFRTIPFGDGEGIQAVVGCPLPGREGIERPRAQRRRRRQAR